LPCSLVTIGIWYLPKTIGGFFVGGGIVVGRVGGRSFSAFKMLVKYRQCGPIRGAQVNTPGQERTQKAPIYAGNEGLNATKTYWYGRAFVKGLPLPRSTASVWITPKQGSVICSIPVLSR
jgi:hypothetical protein